MNCEFKNTTGATFSLGTVSMTFLDSNNVFDKYQESNDPHSDIIFKATGSNKLKELSALVRKHSDKLYRDDIREKLINFSNFLSDSEGVTMTIQ